MNQPGGLADDGVVVSFEEFYEQHHGRVLALSYALSGSWTVAEDVAQEAFARALRDWSRVSQFERADSWVRTVSVNLVRSRSRRVTAEVKARLRLAGRRVVPVEGNHAAEFGYVWHAVRRLPRRQAEVVALHYLDDRSVRDVAGLLGIAEGTVNTLLYQARRTLATILSSQEGDR